MYNMFYIIKLKCAILWKMHTKYFLYNLNVITAFTVYRSAIHATFDLFGISLWYFNKSNNTQDVSFDFYPVQMAN